MMGLYFWVSTLSSSSLIPARNTSGTGGPLLYTCAGLWEGRGSVAQNGVDRSHPHQQLLKAPVLELHNAPPQSSACQVPK